MGYKGVSFPLQLNKRGGILLSDTTVEEPTHLTQALEQLLNTHRFERIMEVTHFCGLEQTIFEDDLSARTLIVDIIVEAITELEPRVKVTEDDITLTVTDEGILAEITYTVLDSGITKTVPIEIGGKIIE